MKFLLFACDEVGFQISCFFKEKRIKPLNLVLDERNIGNYNDKIVEKLGLTKKEVIYSNEIYSEKNIDRLKKAEPDLSLLIWWPKIINKDLISIPRLGTINLHPSYLPYNRGKDPNFWAIKDDTIFGVSIHFVNNDIDAGKIIAQKEIGITWEDTGKTLYEKSKKCIVELFKETFPNILSEDVRATRSNETGTIHYRKDLDCASQIEIDKEYLARDLLNLIRARSFPPHPAAWFLDSGKKYEVRIEIKRVV
jgi:methionyl-tRNA formyltransferase